MALRARIMVIGVAGFLASLPACSSDDSATTGSGGSGGRIDAGTGGAGATGGGGGTVADGSPSDAPFICTAPPYSHVSTFAGDNDGWLAVSPNTPSLSPVVDAETGVRTGTVLELDPADGSPELGSLKLTIPFTQPGEQLLLAFNSNEPLNLTGATVTAQIKLDMGLELSPLNPGQAFLVLKSTSAYYYSGGAPVSLDSSAGWTTLTFNADATTGSPAGYQACDIREIDIQIQTGMADQYTTAIVHIDTIAVTGADAGLPAEEAGPVTTDAGEDATADGEQAAPDAAE